MGLEHLEGRTYRGALGAEAGHVAAFVSATGDDPERWSELTPPGYAAAALFSVAPDLLWDDAVGAFSTVLIHAEQRFDYAAAWPVKKAADVVGVVERVRMRGEVAWVSFRAGVHEAATGDRLIESASLFLMSAGRSDESVEERPEPEPFARGLTSLPEAMPLPGAGEDLARLEKSASRSDLIRYAAASGDFNPLHWDHDTARRAGLAGIVCHGLLSSAWALQQAARHSGSPVPVAQARFRFKRPLLAGEQATVSGSVAAVTGESADLQIEVTGPGGPVVTAQTTIRR